MKRKYIFLTNEFLVAKWHIFVKCTELSNLPGDLNYWCLTSVWDLIIVSLILFQERNCQISKHFLIKENSLETSEKQTPLRLQSVILGCMLIVRW